ncbi:MAG: guanylyltransferase [Acidobacteria bacterium]|nr:guanylyltransferase [Acidobacteriota bacterium]
MKFDDLDKKMRIYETAHDHCVLPGMYIVARIDGRSFTRLTKEKHDFEAPFDVRFRDMMVETVKHLMNCGFKVGYGYTQSDEISLLFDQAESVFQRKERKWNSVLAGEASAKFSLLLGDLAAFDCRLLQLPNPKLVIDYFRWRNEDAHRNALNAHCYWLLRKEGKSRRQATQAMSGMSIGQKNQFLFERGVSFNDLPQWQKRGIGFHWATVSKQGRNPKTGQTVHTTRRVIQIDPELPMRDAYDQFLAKLLATNEATP